MSERDPKPWVDRLREDTRRYLETLLNENGRLRDLTASLESDTVRLRGSELRLQRRLRALEQEIERHREERDRLQRRVADFELDNRRYSSQFVEIESHSNALANLYVASYRLHSTLERGEVLEALREIVVNLLGSEDFVVFQRGSDGAGWEVATHFGSDLSELRSLPLDNEPYAGAAADGERWVGDETDSDTDGRPLLCQPLRLGDETVGLLVLFSLLPQKRALEPTDFELLDLLSTHAAMALYTARLHEQAVGCSAVLP